MENKRKNIVEYCITVLLVCVVSSFVRAEDVGLEKIVITPSKIQESYGTVARKIDIITADDIERSSSKDVAEALQRLSSVNISSYGGLGASKTMRMRGSTGSQVLVMIDGRPLNSPRDGEIDLSTIPLANIERIEVMHGPASSIYGSSAMGGAVNIITKRPPEEKTHTELSTSFGTFRTYNELLAHGGRIADAGYLVSTEYQSSEGFRDNSEFNARSANAKIEYTPTEESLLTFNASFFNSNLGTPGLISSPDTDDKQDVLKNSQDITFHLGNDERAGITAKAYQNYDKLAFSENSAGSIFDIAQNKYTHTTVVRGLELQADKQLLENDKLILGVTYTVNTNDSTVSAKHKYSVKAGYLENHLSFFDRLHFTLGARFDDYSNFGTETSPSAGVSYQPIEKVKIHGLIARSFKAPTFNDLYWPDEGWVKGNPNLTPEKGITSEFGVSAEPVKNIFFDLTYYRNNYDQLISWAETQGVWMPQNVNSALIDGVEFESAVSFLKVFTLETGYAFLHARDDKAQKFLIYQPKHKAHCLLRYRPSGKSCVEMRGEFTDKRYHDQENSVKVKRFFTLGLSATHTIKPGFTYFMAIDNLLNYNYQVIKDYPASGFSVSNGIKIEF